MEWKEKFIENHGDRLFFMSVTTLFGIGFVVAGLLVEALNEALLGVGITLLIGVAQQAHNKSRSPKTSEEKEK